MTLYVNLHEVLYIRLLRIQLEQVSDNLLFVALEADVIDEPARSI